jgi:hypothetical protein
MVKNYLECLSKGSLICFWVVQYRSKYPSPTMTIANRKGEDITNEIYSWLLTCQVQALEDVALFDLNFFYGLW